MSLREGLTAVSRKWLNALNWGLVTIPPLVAFSDNIGSFQIVAGQSMNPTLNPHPESRMLDIVYVSKVTDFTQGDVVLLYDPIQESRKRIVKRVSSISSDGSSVVVLGDNPAHSTDSRHFGPVPSVLVEGVVSAIVFPPWRWTRIIPKPSGSSFSSSA